MSLFESPWNPRKYFSEPGLVELAESIRGKGITTPLIVRPTENGFEIGAGARRYRAAKIAQVNLVPCIVRKLNDDEFRKLVCFENMRREDPHPLEEAAALLAYREQTNCTIERLCQESGESRSQVYARLKLAKDLIPEAVQACYDNKITAGHAILIARLQVKEQEKALKFCTNGYNKPSVRALQQWIHDDVCLEMAKAPFDLSDAQLVPDELKGNRTIEGPGSCTHCPKRSINSPDLFPELQLEAIRAEVVNDPDNAEEIPERLEEEIQDRMVRSDVCTHPGCFHRKLKAHLVRIETKLQEQHGEVVKVSSKWGDGKADVPGKSRYDLVKKAEPGAKLALVVDGEDAGKTIYVKVKPKASSSSSSPAYGSEEYKRQEAEREAQQKREEDIQRKIFEAVGKKVQSLTRADIERVVRNELRALCLWGMGQVLCELHGLPVNQTGNAERLLDQRISKMDGPEFARLVMEIGCMSDDGIEGAYLLAAAKRYKVDAAKIRAEFEAQEKGAEQVKPEASAKKEPGKKAPVKSSQKLSSSARRRIAAAQKKRWSEFKKRQAKAAKK